MEFIAAHLPLALGLGAAGLAVIFFLARRLSRSAHRGLDWGRAASFSAGIYKPLERLLLEDDYAFLRSQRGYQLELATALRRQRREIFSDYIARLADDFRALHQIARVTVLNHQEDSPELVSALVRQSATFRYALLRIRVRLALDTIGIQRATFKPADIRPLLDAARWMEDQLRLISPQPSASAA